MEDGSHPVYYTGYGPQARTIWTTGTYYTDHRLLPYGLQVLTIWTTGSYHMDYRYLLYGPQALTIWTTQSLNIRTTGSYDMDHTGSYHMNHRLLPNERDDQRLATDVRCSEQIQHSVMATLLLLSDIALNLVLALKGARREQRLLFQR